MRWIRNGSRVIVLVLLAQPLVSCTDYVDRQETVSLSAGDAVSRNVATHMVDPWPVHARDTRLASSGERAARAVRRYENCFYREEETTLTSIEIALVCEDTGAGSALAAPTR